MFKTSTLAIVAVFIASAALSDTIYVPDDYPGIRSAVQAAASGDVVIVAAGTYAGPDNRNIDFAGKNIDLIAASGSEVTAINCENSGFGIRIQDMTTGAASIQGFRIYNATGGNGAGIIINRANHVTVSGCIIYDCSATLNGGGVFIGYSTSSTFIDNCVIETNQAQFRGGGLMIDHAPNTFIRDTIVRSNTVVSANYGGGGVFENASTYVAVERCTFIANGGGGVGHALYFAGNMFVSNSIFRSNGSGPSASSFAGPFFEHGRFSCCDVFETTQPADIDGIIAINDNFGADPIFCPSGDYTLSQHSPCLTGPCGQIGARGDGCGDYLRDGTPLILSIADVGNDQGRQVRLRWAASRNHPDIAQYIVFRRIGDEKAAPLGDWDLVAVVPEVGLAEYNLVVPTLCDSTISGGQCESTFFIRATTGNALDTYDSPFWSGYSLDNLEPSMPAGLVLAGRLLSWEEARDPDVRHFSIYGGPTSDPDGSEVLIGYATGTSFDVSGHLHDYYHVSATDFSGNEGPPATVTSGVSGTPGAATSRTELLYNIPNPFNPATRIVYNLGSALPVHLSIYDISGRLVRQLERGGIKPAGRNEVHWDGRDGAGSHVAAGVYFYRLEAGRYAETRRMMLVK